MRQEKHCYTDTIKPSFRTVNDPTVTMSDVKSPYRPTDAFDYGLDLCDYNENDMLGVGVQDTMLFTRSAPTTTLMEAAPTFFLDESQLQPEDAVLNHSRRQHLPGQKAWMKLRGDRRKITKEEAHGLIDEFEAPQLRGSEQQGLDFGKYSGGGLDDEEIRPRLLYKDKNGKYRKATIEEIRKNVNSNNRKKKVKSSKKRKVSEDAADGGGGGGGEEEDDLGDEDEELLFTSQNFIPQPTTTTTTTDGFDIYEPIKLSDTPPISQMFLEANKVNDVSNNYSSSSLPSSTKTIREFASDYMSSLHDMEGRKTRNFRAESQLFRRTLDSFLTLPYADDAPPGPTDIWFSAYEGTQTIIQRMWNDLCRVFLEEQHQGSPFPYPSPSSGAPPPPPPPGSGGNDFHNNSSNGKYSGGGGGAGGGGSSNGGGGYPFGPSGGGSGYQAPGWGMGGQYQKTQALTNVVEQGSSDSDESDEEDSSSESEGEQETDISTEGSGVLVPHHQQEVDEAAQLGDKDNSFGEHGWPKAHTAEQEDRKISPVHAGDEMTQTLRDPEEVEALQDTCTNNQMAGGPHNGDEDKNLPNIPEVLCEGEESLSSHPSKEGSKNDKPTTPNFLQSRKSLPIEREQKSHGFDEDSEDEDDRGDKKKDSEDQGKKGGSGDDDDADGGDDDNGETPQAPIVRQAETVHPTMEDDFQAMGSSSQTARSALYPARRLSDDGGFQFPSKATDRATEMFGKDGSGGGKMEANTGIRKASPSSGKLGKGSDHQGGRIKGIHTTSNQPLKAPLSQHQEVELKQPHPLSKMSYLGQTTGVASSSPIVMLNAATSSSSSTSAPGMVGISGDSKRRALQLDLSQIHLATTTTTQNTRGLLQPQQKVALRKEHGFCTDCVGIPVELYSMQFGSQNPVYRDVPGECTRGICLVCHPNHSSLVTSPPLNISETPLNLKLAEAKKMSAAAVAKGFAGGGGGVDMTKKPARTDSNQSSRSIGTAQTAAETIASSTSSFALSVSFPSVASCDSSAFDSQAEIMFHPDLIIDTLNKWKNGHDSVSESSSTLQQRQMEQMNDPHRFTKDVIMQMKESAGAGSTMLADAVVSFMRENVHEEAVQVYCLQEIGAICTMNDQNIDSFVEMKAPDAIVMAMKEHMDSTNVQTSGWDALGSLCVDSSKTITFAKVILSTMFRSGKEEDVQVHCLNMIWEICKGNHNKNANAFMETNVPAVIVWAMNKFKESKRVQKSGCGALWSLCVDGPTTVQLVKAEACKVVVETLLRSLEDRSTQKLAMGIIRTFSREKRARESFLKYNATHAALQSMEKHESSAQIQRHGCEFLTNFACVMPAKVSEREMKAVVQAMLEHHEDTGVMSAACLTLTTYAKQSNNLDAMCRRAEIEDLRLAIQWHYRTARQMLHQSSAPSRWQCSIVEEAETLLQLIGGSDLPASMPSIREDDETQ
jgi:hypothetical protein